jgi:N4-gp56 family major capsid protein
VGTSASSKRLVSSGNTAGSNVAITALNPDGALAPVAPATGITVHNVFIIGKGAYGITDLSAVERYITPAQATDSDPLAQRRKTGWKAFFKTIILNQDFIAKIECASAY